MSQKNRYQLFTLGAKLSKNPMIYNFSTTKNIKMTVTEKYFFIQVDRTVKTSPEKILDDLLFRDAIKKACLIQLVLYGKIYLRLLKVSVNNEETIIYDSEKSRTPLVYGICGNSLARKMSNNWGYPQFERILKKTKTKTDRLDASLYALLVAKSKTFETERFMYLWMSFNGVYGHIASEASSHAQDNKVTRWIKNETAQLKFVSMFFDYPYQGVKKSDSDSYRFDMEMALAKVKVEEIQDFVYDLKNHRDNEHIKVIQKILQDYDLENRMCEYAALCIHFPYLIRCKYFHGEKAIPLLCYANEHPLPVLRVLNTVLEDFLDEMLYQFMNDNVWENQFKPRIASLINACKIGKDQRLESCVVDGRNMV